MILSAGGAPPFVAGLGERPDHRETRDRRVLAPCWISAILATAIPSSTPRPAEGQPGGSAADSAHEVRQPILGCASHSRRTSVECTMFSVNLQSSFTVISPDCYTSNA